MRATSYCHLMVLTLAAFEEVSRDHPSIAEFLTRPKPAFAKSKTARISKGKFGKKKEMTEEEGAAVIQAGVRGRATRRKLTAGSGGTGSSSRDDGGSQK